MLFCTTSTWGDASWSQLRPGEVSHRSVKFGGVGGAEGEHRIDACQKLLQTTFLGDNFNTDSRTMISPVLLPNSIRFHMDSSHRCLFSTENARTFRRLSEMESNRPREPRPQCSARSQGRTGTSDRRHPPSGAKCPPHRRWDTYSERCVPSVYSATFQPPTQISTPSPKSSCAPSREPCSATR